MLLAKKSSCFMFEDLSGYLFKMDAVVPPLDLFTEHFAFFYHKW